MMNNISFPKAIKAGILGTVAMTLTAMAAPMMGMPEMNVPKMLSGVMNAPLILGWAAHFMIGIVLAISYAVIFFNKLQGYFLIKGMLFSLIPWLMAQLIVMPLMALFGGMSFVNGLFSGSLIMALGSLIGHLMYGMVLGITYRRVSSQVIIDESILKELDFNNRCKQCL